LNLSQPAFEYHRRRYGRTTYTWVTAVVDGVRIELGDPWPCLKPPMREILFTLNLKLQPKESK
jgi:hypothetical protein